MKSFYEWLNGQCGRDDDVGNAARKWVDAGCPELTSVYLQNINASSAYRKDIAWLRQQHLDFYIRGLSDLIKDADLQGVEIFIRRRLYELVDQLHFVYSVL